MSETKITCEPGRTIHIDGAPAFYVNIARSNKTGGYNMAPWQADSIARQIAAAMRAGIIRVPRDLEDGAALDANPPGAAPDRGAPGAAPKTAAQRLVDTVNATGGIVRFKDGTVAPAVDEDWIDLGDAYLQACAELNVPPAP